jgi:hypothetical protein
LSNFENLVKKLNLNKNVMENDPSRVVVLLFQELKLKGEFATQSEADLLNELARPSIKEFRDESLLKYPYENLPKDEKAKYLQKLDTCLTLFTNTFFECFKQLYNGLHTPFTKELQVAFFENRQRITDKTAHMWAFCC